MRLVRPAGPAGRPPAQPDAAWLAVHAWRWNPARLGEQLIAEAEQFGVASLWLCGQAANALDLVDRFDAVLLLDIDQATMPGRMQRPERGNDFGRVGDSLDAALAGYRPFVAAWRRVGARRVDATGTWPPSPKTCC